MRSALRKMGNSSGVIIPKPLLGEIGARPGDDVELTVEAGRIVIALIERQPRAGWADDARAIGEAEDDAFTWPEFGNDDDVALRW
jgi:antitoxin MazE